MRNYPSTIVSQFFVIRATRFDEQNLGAFGKRNEIGEFHLNSDNFKTRDIFEFA